MKENSIKNERSSIEEDMKILEEFKTHGYAMLLIKYEDRNKTNLKIEQTIEHILSDYKRVLKENEELKKDRDKFKKALGRKITYCNELEKDLFENSSNYVIKKQKVKDKIEELNQYYKKEIYPSLLQWRDLTITEHYDEMIELLHEIIGDK